MRKWWMVGASVLLGLSLTVGAYADEHEAKLPAGPIRDRHELMEGNGADAKAIGEAMKAGDMAKVAERAAHIQAEAPKIPGLFPKGSTHPESRAKPEIWEHWDKFVQLSKDMEAAAGKVAATAKAGGNVGATTGPLFFTCKSCHDEFRVPKEEGK
jgi:cytochrome c556